MLEQTLYSNGNNKFEDNIFSGREWSAPTMVDVTEITKTVNSFHLVGRKNQEYSVRGSLL